MYFQSNPHACRLHSDATAGLLQGQVLNQTSAWWMRHTQHIAPNALLSTPDPNVSEMKKCAVFPVEFVVRGFMTGRAPLYADPLPA